jgi:hypothetical protein
MSSVVVSWIAGTKRVSAGMEYTMICSQALAHLRVVEHLRQDAHIDLTGLTAAGTAVQARRMGIVARAAAMAGKEDHRRKVARKGHGPEYARGQARLGGRIQYTVRAAELKMRMLIADSIDWMLLILTPDRSFRAAGGRRSRYPRTRRSRSSPVRSC